MKTVIAEHSAGNTTRGLDAWMERMGDEALPAVTTAARQLDSVARNDTSTLSQIGKVVMHDAALTSQVLKAANSILYNPTGRAISTLSRASVVLGFQTMRSICMTAKLLTDLLDRGGISPAVHQRLMQLVACSLHAAVQARNLMGNASDESLEEVFIAGLLGNLGASAFWALGGAESETLDQLLKDGSGAPERVIADYLGTSFDSLSLGLAKRWNLGSTLVDSLGGEDSKRQEIHVVRLGRDIARVSAEKGWDSDEARELLKQASRTLGVTEDAARNRLLDNARATLKLAACYGVDGLDKYMPTRPVKAEHPRAARLAGQKPSGGADESVQLRVLRDLTAMMGQKPDFNRVINAAMEGIQSGIGMDRTVTALLDAGNKTVTGRFALGERSDDWISQFRFSLGPGDSLFTLALKTNAPSWFDPLNAPSNRGQIGAELDRFCTGHGCMIAPISIARRPVAFIYADRQPSKGQITAEDFASFSHFAQQIGLCLSMISSDQA